MAKDVDLFTAAMSDVAPLKGPGRRLAVTPKANPVPATKTIVPGAKEGLVPVRALRSMAQPLEPFDRDVDRALARGRRRPEATLDLHGMTLASAERAVAVFLSEASGRGLRVVLVVTGKGLRMESGRVFGGRIRAEFPGWLERPENRQRIAGVRAAHPRHGGAGAFYILLRRRTARE